MIAKRIFNEFCKLFPEYSEDVSDSEHHYYELKQFCFKETPKHNTILIDLMDGKNYEFTFTSKHDWCLKISGPKYKKQ